MHESAIRREKRRSQLPNPAPVLQLLNKEDYSWYYYLKLLHAKNTQTYCAYKI